MLKIITIHNEFVKFVVILINNYGGYVSNLRLLRVDLNVRITSKIGIWPLQTVTRQIKLFEVRFKFLISKLCIFEVVLKVGKFVYTFLKNQTQI